MMLPRYNLRRIIFWTLPNRYYRLYSRIVFKPFQTCIVRDRCQCFLSDRGDNVPHTAVTTRQLELLLKAVDETEDMASPIAEVGSYRGATTRSLAERTKRLVYAVDPHAGWGGSQKDYQFFRAAVQSFPNVRHLRTSSGEAAQMLAGERFSLVFIDAIHDYPNTRYDFVVWSALLDQGGMVAFHDVDDWPGTNAACRRILKERKDFEIWGYCPNLAILRQRNL